MALQDLLDLSTSRRKIGLSPERVEAVMPTIRKYIAFWREYPDLFVDFMVRGTRTEVKDGEFCFLFLSKSFPSLCYEILVCVCGFPPCIF